MLEIEGNKKKHVVLLGIQIFENKGKNKDRKLSVRKDNPVNIVGTYQTNYNPGLMFVKDC